MSKAKFTKGPWIAGHLGSDRKCQCRSILSEGYMGCIATVEVDNGRLVSDGGNDAPPLSESVANMHLIAAAPELYEALEWLEVYAKVQIERFPMADDTDGWKKVLSALAKARGEV